MFGYSGAQGKSLFITAKKYEIETTSPELNRKQRRLDAKLSICEKRKKDRLVYIKKITEKYKQNKSV